jgi:hypothetical protein
MASMLLREREVQFVAAVQLLSILMTPADVTLWLLAAAF